MLLGPCTSAFVTCNKYVLCLWTLALRWCWDATGDGSGRIHEKRTVQNPNPLESVHLSLFSTVTPWSQLKLDMAPPVHRYDKSGVALPSGRRAVCEEKCHCKDIKEVALNISRLGLDSTFSKWSIYAANSNLHVSHWSMRQRCPQPHLKSDRN